MAAESCNKKPIRSKGFINYTTACYALKITAEGIEPFVFNEIEQFQQKCLADICINNGLPSGTVCSSCCTENVVKCPYDRKCNVGREQCKYHNHVRKQYLSDGCPNQICHNLKNKIQSAHRFNGPTYKNTDATQWCTNSWEVAKCFMPPDGYKDVKSSAKTDFNGLINVIINYKYLQTKISEDLSKTNNIFVKGRQVGRDIRHPPASMEFEDAKLQQCLTDLQNILSDTDLCAGNKHIQTARNKLSQVQKGQSSVDILEYHKMLLNIEKEIRQDITNTKEDMSMAFEYQKLKMIKAMKTSLEKIELTEKTTLSEINDAFKSALSVVERKTDYSINKMLLETEEEMKQKSFEKKKASTEFVEKIEAKRMQGERQIHQEVEAGVTKLKTEAGVGVEQITLLTEKSIQWIDYKLSTRDIEAEDNKYYRLQKDLVKGVRLGLRKDEDDLKKECEKQKLKLDNAKTNNAETIETTGMTSIFEINDVAQSAESELNSFQIHRDEDKRMAKLEREADTGVIPVPVADNDIYYELKKEFKEDLADFNRKRHSTIPLVPLFEEKETPILDFYLMPGMNIVKMDNGKEEKDAVKSLSEVYKSGSKCSNDIYVTAEAGFGKTAFSKYQTALWCQAHFPDVKHTAHFNKECVDTMREFEFIFLMLLRDSTDDCSIDDMIFNQVVQNLSHSKSYSEQFLQEILHREKCLVVLDGLDEWTHPNTKCGKVVKSIPHRNARDNCTILTTTKPSKLSIMNLGHNYKKIELTNLDVESALKLTTRALKIIKGRKEIGEYEMEVRNEAKQLIKIYHDFEHIYVPLSLMYIICLWCDDIPLGKTKCGLYTHIIELLLSRAISKYKNVSEVEPLQCISNIPECFSEQEHCKAYFTFLTSLGELAIETLFSEISQHRIVFDSSIAENCLKEDFLELCLLTGIITIDKQTKLTSQMCKCSFSHKIVQDFFAALYISTCSGQDKVLIKVLSFCNSIQDILYLSDVFIFISGFNVELFSLFSNKFMEVINIDEMSIKCRSATEPGYNHPMREIQEMFVSGIQEIPDNKDVHLCLQDFFFDKQCKKDKYYTSLQRLALQSKTNIRSIHVFFPGSRSLSEIIDECGLSDPVIYCQAISCVPCKENEIIRLLSTSVKSLVALGIQRDNESKDARSYLTDEQSKTFHNYSQLETINIWHAMVSQRFLNYILNVKSVKEIALFNVSCSDHGDSTPGFNFDISQHSEIRKLVLASSNFMLCDKSEEESSLLHKMRNIECVELTEVKMSSLLLRRLVEIIAQLEHSVRVQLCFCNITPIREFENIRDYICRSESFVVEKDYRDLPGRDLFEFVTHR